MGSYLLRRMFLIPLTLLCILLVNFVILNLAPGDPSTVSDAAVRGDGTRDAGHSQQSDRDDQYLVFREHYGLTLPVLVNSWPSTSREQVLTGLQTLVDRRRPGNSEEMRARVYNEYRIRFGDRSRYIMPTLLGIAADATQRLPVREMALRFFVRGGTRMGFVGPNLTHQQQQFNRTAAADNHYLRQVWQADTPLGEKVSELKQWYADHRSFYGYELSPLQKAGAFFWQTRWARYLKRVLTLDFGTLRNDSNRTVVHEVAKRFKYSLTLAVMPMIVTFLLCQLFGFMMACRQGRWPDYALNVIFLILFAVPIFVVAPFLIERIALPRGLPVSGFHSADDLYQQLTSWERLRDVVRHLALPLIAVMYGTLAVQSRLSRTAVLEVMRQDYVRTARAKGVPPFPLLWKHVGRNAAITIVTALAASLGTILAGSLIVETIFGIDGFGRFFYDSIINRDYNVILFSTLASAVLALIGYLLADLAYTLLDPRVSLK